MITIGKGPKGHRIIFQQISHTAGIQIINQPDLIFLVI